MDRSVRRVHRVHVLQGQRGIAPVAPGQHEADLRQTQIPHLVKRPHPTRYRVCKEFVNSVTRRVIGTIFSTAIV